MAGLNEEDYSPSGSYPTFPVVLPLDGKALSHANLVNGILKPLFNGVGFADPAKTGTGLIGTSVTRVLPPAWFVSSAGWAPSSVELVWAAGTAGSQVALAVQGLPHGATLTGFGVRWAGASGHAGLPTMPSIRLDRVPLSGIATTVGSVTDTSASVAAYQAAHSIAATGLTHTIDVETGYYVLVVSAESAPNFVAFASMFAPFVVFTPVKGYAG